MCYVSFQQTKSSASSAAQRTHLYPALSPSHLFAGIGHGRCASPRCSWLGPTLGCCWWTTCTSSITACCWVGRLLFHAWQCNCMLVNVVERWRAAAVHLQHMPCCGMVPCPTSTFQPSAPPPHAGLFTLSMAAAAEERHLLAALLFSALLCFKHIFLYAAPAFFVYMLRRYCRCSGCSPANKQQAVA